jgi:2',3'-cyclic-nucleotide 2'-phosphodiesterase/3'-nucleotidase
MQALGFDAANIGNHEFNFGLPFLGRALETAGFPYVNANIVIDDGSGKPETMKPAYTPYVVLQRNFVDDAGRPVPLKVGVIGFVPPQVMLWDRQHLQGKVVALDIVETANRYIPRMKTEGADLIAVLAHSGFERGETARFAENTVARLAEVKGVDAILFGHSHGEFPGRFFNTHPKVDLARGTINGVPAVMAGRWGDHLGVIDLRLRQEGGRWKVADSRAELRPIFDREARKPRVEADAELLRLIQPEHEATLAYVRSPVAQTTAPIQSYFAQVADDASVQLVSQAQLAYARRALADTPHARLPLLSAAAPFKTGGRQGWAAYTDIPAGPVAVRNVADLYVFPNTLQVVKLSGAQVREWLEFSAGAFNRIDPKGPAEQDLLNTAFPSFNFDTLDGLTYSIDLTQPARYERSGKLVQPKARRIRDLQFNGKPVSDRDSFAVVTNNYRASGGGNFPGLDGSNIILQAPDENREVLRQYLQGLGTVEPAADRNWQLLPVRGIQLRFLSSAAGRAHLERTPNVRWVRDNGDGSAVYEVVP